MVDLAVGLLSPGPTMSGVCVGRVWGLEGELRVRPFGPASVASRQAPGGVVDELNKKLVMSHRG